jgi:phage tail P2-like protein
MVDSLLPPNATAEERALEAAMARIEGVPIPVKDLTDPEICPANLLPFMAWAMSVDNWSPDWPESIKRKVYAAALKVHQIKGTEGAVIDALSALGLKAVVNNWFEYSGERGKFKVDIDLEGRGYTEEESSGAVAVILNAKNTRSHLDTITIHLANRSDTPKLASALISSQEMTVYPYQIPEFTHHTDTPHIGATLQFLHDLTILPQGTH